MSNEWTHRIVRATESDKYTAATLAAALIARGFTLPAATNASMAAAQAVDLYQSVLAKLNPVSDAEEHADQQAGGQTPPSDDLMLQLGITHDGARYRYQDYAYERMADALNYARLDRARAKRDIVTVTDR